MAQLDTEQVLRTNGGWMKSREIVTHVEVNARTVIRHLNSLLHWGRIQRRRIKDGMRSIYEYKFTGEDDGKI